MSDPPPAKRIKVEPRGVSLSQQKRRPSGEPVLLVRLRDIKLFSQALHAIGKFQNEVEFQFGGDTTGFTIAGLDMAHVAYFDYALLPVAFDVYQIREYITFGVRITEFCKLIDPNKTLGSMEIMLQERNSESIQLRFFDEGEEESGPSQIIALRSITVDQNRHTVPEVSYNAQLDCPTAVLKHYMKQFGDLEISTLDIAAKIEVIESGSIPVVTMHSKGTLVDVTNRFVNNVKECGVRINVVDENKEGQITETEPLVLSISLPYLDRCVLAGKWFKTVSIYMHPEIPFKIHYSLQKQVVIDPKSNPKKTKMVKLGHLTFFVAPKLPEDDLV